MSNGKYDAADLAHLNKRDRQMSRKSEYKRLAVQIPDVVKVIREQVLDEAIGSLKQCSQGLFISEYIKVIENLKNK